MNSIQAYWTSQFQRSRPRSMRSRRPSSSRLDHTGCGAASSDVGPFYCPVDKHVYIDLGFFDELRTPLRRQRRAVRAGLRARARVRPPRPGPARPASERLRPGRRHKGARCAPSSRPTASPASGRTTRRRQAISTDLTEADIADGLNAAAAVGDDRIQARDAGPGEPETWTHGSSSQRQHWFTVGYKAGKPAACDTFSSPL